MMASMLTGGVATRREWGLALVALLCTLLAVLFQCARTL